MASRPVKRVTRDMAAILRREIRASGLSVNEFSERCDVPQSTLQAFMAKKDIRLKTASRIAAWLGLELRKKTRATTTKKRRKA